MSLPRRRFLRNTALATLGSALASPAMWASEEFLQESLPFPLVDGLCFLPKDADDIRRSGLTAFIADVSAVSRVDTSDGSLRYYRSFEACSRSIVAARRRLREEIPQAFLALKGSQVGEAFSQGQTAVFFQFQGLEPLGEDLERLDLFYELGLRVQQMTHHNDNPFAGGALEPRPKGLTHLGLEAVERMNRLGIVPDVSHASDRTALDVTRRSKRPVILSHGAARALVNNARCAPDEVIRAVAETGGMMGIFMMSFWLTEEPEPSIEHLVRQIRHVIRVGGLEAVGIANDFPLAGQPALSASGNDNAQGVKSYLPWWNSIARQGIRGFERPPRHVVIPELNRIERIFVIDQALHRSGFTHSQREKIMGGNWIRVLTESLG